ncbi:MAG TPA: ankyrin repeat domain-containing protein, partial [Gemmatimonadaceae bacterium]|nr:ankyrin repeat domain-containing protein [Gemmatimonadaceae bacterium]
VNSISTSEHNRPLHRAIEQGHADVVDVLLSSGADIEARGTWLKITPLAKAAFEGRSSIVDVLVKQGAKVDRFAAAAIGRVGKAINGVDGNGLTTLHYCAGSALSGVDLLKIAERLIAKGADPCARAAGFTHNVTPIKLAVRNQRVAEFLLDQGADPNDVFRDVLLTGCNFPFAEALRARGAELNPVMWDDETLLHVAIHCCRIASAEWLLEKGANPNTARAKNLWTPLHQAASRGNARIVSALLEHGASPKSRDRDGQTPLDVAREKRRTAVVEVLERVTQDSGD